MSTPTPAEAVTASRPLVMVVRLVVIFGRWVSRVVFVVEDSAAIFLCFTNETIADHTSSLVHRPTVTRFLVRVTEKFHKKLVALRWSWLSRDSLISAEYSLPGSPSSIWRNVLHFWWDWREGEWKNGKCRGLWNGSKFRKERTIREHFPVWLVCHCNRRSRNLLGISGQCEPITGA